MYGLCYDFIVNKGNTFELPIVVYEDNSVNLTNFTGHTAQLTIGRKIANGTIDPNIILKLTTENGGLFLGGVFGTVDIYISKEQTALLPLGNLIYDLIMKNQLGESRKLFFGTIKMQEGISQW